MSTLSQLTADAFVLLQKELYGHLDEAEFLAGKCAEWTDEDGEAARKLIPDLVIIFCGLLLEHQIRPGGDCRICTSAWSCPVVTAIHGLLKDPQRQFVALVIRAREKQY